MADNPDNNQGAGRLQAYEAFKAEPETPAPPPTPEKKKFKVNLVLKIPNMLELPLEGVIEEI